MQPNPGQGKKKKKSKRVIFYQRWKKKFLIWGQWSKKGKKGDFKMILL